MALAPEAKLSYPLAGPAGTVAFNAGVQGFEAQSFRGLGVFTSTPVSQWQEHSHTLHFSHPFHRPPNSHMEPPTPCCHSQYEVSDDQDSVQMLQRSTQVGEFYRMSPPAVFDVDKKLPPSYMDIM